MLFFISALFTLGNAQTDCIYKFGVAELDLQALRGNRYIFQDAADQSVWQYSPCQSNMQCSSGGILRDVMIDHSPQGINECHAWATYNDSTYPFLDLAIGSWIFNFSNGEPCRDGSQINNTVTLLWTCDEDRGTPRVVDVFRPNECNAIMELEWSGACFAAPPPNEECKFKSGFQTLDLSKHKGQTFSLQEKSQNGNTFTYEFTPCANGLSCDSATSGYSAQVMADIRDSGNQCAKYLGIWSGDAMPFYDRTIFGQDYWDFFWMDGEQCGSGNPLEILNVRYYCNPKIADLNITRAYSNAPCSFRIEIDSASACPNVSSVAKPNALIAQHKKLQKMLAD